MVFSTLVERPARRFLLSVCRPFLVCIRARKPLLRFLLTLLLRWFSIRPYPLQSSVLSARGGFIRLRRTGRHYTGSRSRMQQRCTFGGGASEFLWNRRIVV